MKIYIDSIGNRNYTANWKANELIFSGATFSRTYGDATSSVSFTGASNGTGLYTYTEKSEKNSSGSNTNYIEVSGTNITIQNTIPAGTYKYVVNAYDYGSGSTKDAEFTINVAKAASAVYCNSAQTYTGGEFQSPLPPFRHVASLGREPAAHLFRAGGGYERQAGGRSVRLHGAGFAFPGYPARLGADEADDAPCLC